ncbi:hypothetical protein KI387_002913, partial [Taxus chinensis]
DLMTTTNEFEEENLLGVRNFGSVYRGDLNDGKSPFPLIFVNKLTAEYGAGGSVFTKGDVYSYEILILNMVTRNRPSDDMSVGDMNFINSELPREQPSMRDVAGVLESMRASFVGSVVASNLITAISDLLRNTSVNPTWTSASDSQIS